MDSGSTNVSAQVSRTTRWYTSDPPRSLALVFGLAFVATFVSVFYRILDVVGGVSSLLIVVTLTILLATVSARLLPVREAATLGAILLVGGIALYIHFAPFQYRTVFSLGFLVNLATYLTGISVLQFQRIDVWALVVAPGPVFLTWYLFMRRRYDQGVAVGGVTLLFFVLTGDATWSTTFLGSMSALGVVAMNELERTNWSWAQLEQFGMVLVGATLVSRTIQHNLDARATQVSADARPSTGGDGDSISIESSLLESDGRVRVFDRITLSPTVRFRVTTDVPDFLHVASYDRYTGGGWIRSGQATRYSGELESPPGETTSVEQTVRAEATIETMPAAWKPVRVSREVREDTRVTSTGGLDPARPLRRGDEYTVASEVLDRTPERLRSVGGTYPDHVQERYLQLPESTPARVWRKARDITEGATTIYDAAAAIEDWLETNKTYSLEVDRPDGAIADAFIFEMDSGYCVYFATAMAVLLRSIDVPARFAHGYLPGEQVDDDAWIVRGLDSHAWTEVYIPDAGWVPFDPTPADPRQRAEQERIDEARTEDVSGVDTDETRTDTDAATTMTPPDASVQGQNASSVLFGDLDAAQSPTPASTTETNSSVLLEDEPDANFDPWERLSTALSRMDRVTVAASVAGLFLGLHRLRLLERGYREFRIRRQRRTESPYTDVTRAFDRLEHLLERRYRPRASGETPRRYIETFDPEIDPRAADVLRHYERAHYSGGISRKEADEAIRLVDEIAGTETFLDALVHGATGGGTRRRDERPSQAQPEQDRGHEGEP